VKPLQSSKKGLILALAMVIVLARCAAAGTLAGVELSGDDALVTLKGSLKGASAPRLENHGNKVVIKLKDAVQAAGLKAPAGKGIVKQLRIGDHKGGLWIVADLNAPASVSSAISASGFTVKFSPKAASAPAKEGSAKDEASQEPIQSLAPANALQTARIVDVSLGEAGGDSQVVVSSDAPVSYKTAVSEGGKKVSISFRNASLAWTNADIAGDDPALSSLKARQVSIHGESQVVIDLVLKDKLPYTITRDQNQVMVNVSRLESANAPADKAKGNIDALVSVDIQGADLVGVLRSVAEEAGFQSKISDSILALQGSIRQVTYNAVNRPLREVLWGLLHENANLFIFKSDGTTLYFGLATELGQLAAGKEVTTKFYTPRNQIKTVLESLVKSSAKEPWEGLATMDDDPTDPEKIMVAGTVDSVATTMKYLRRWDVPETGEAATGEENASDDPAPSADAASADDSGAKKTKIYQLKYIDPADPLIAAGIVQVIPPAVITAGSFVYNVDNVTRKLMVTAKLKYIKAIDHLMEHLDVQQPQVHIEGKIVEVDTNDTKSLGINWNFTQTNNSASGNQTQSILGFSAGTGGPATATLSNLSGVGTQTISNLFATLDALVSVKKANVISSPSLTVKDGQAASMNAQDTIVIESSTIIFGPTGQPTTTNTFTNQTIPISLGVTPRISPDEGKVEMLINFNLTTVNGVAPAGQPAPTTSQTIQTTVMVSNGETAVIGGLSKDSYTHSATSVPILGDIPLLGMLFRNDQVAKEKSDIIIFITPTIVQE
jgi:hypothetical protein